MPSATDDLVSQAGREAWHLAQGVSLHTLELRHESFAAPIRIVRDYGTPLDPEDPDGLRGHWCRIEAGAPADAGELVAFLACMFDATLPAQQPDTPPSMEIVIDNVASLLADQLDIAVEFRSAIEVTYREYLAGDRETLVFKVSGMSLQRVLSDIRRVRGTCVFIDLVNASFPNITYRPARFPGLAANL